MQSLELENIKLHDKIYWLWFNWEGREDYSQFLYLVLQDFNHNEDYRIQENKYLRSLLAEFESTGKWSKLES